MDSKHFFPLALAATVLARVRVGRRHHRRRRHLPLPDLSQVGRRYKKPTGNGMNYQSIGSGGGIKQITAKTVDFGASDMPMKAEDLQKNGLIQFPAIMGGVVPVVQARGREARRAQVHRRAARRHLPRQGREVERPGDREAEPGVKLPGDDITVVHRSDGSGTTFLWTNYLSKVSPEFKAPVGEGTSVKWPAAWAARATRAWPRTCRRSTARSATSSTRTRKQNKLAYGQVQNKVGQVRRARRRHLQGAAAGAD
jgi:phosphate transport system substrate-binding protein